MSRLHVADVVRSDARPALPALGTPTAATPPSATDRLLDSSKAECETSARGRDLRGSRARLGGDPLT